MDLQVLQNTTIPQFGTVSTINEQHIVHHLYCLFTHCFKQQKQITFENNLRVYTRRHGEYQQEQIAKYKLFANK